MSTPEQQIQHQRDQLKLISELARTGAEFINAPNQDHNNDIEYITQCNKLVHQYLLSGYGNDFIYSSFAYLNEEKVFSSVPYFFYAKPANGFDTEHYWQSVSWHTDIPGNGHPKPALAETVNSSENYKSRNLGTVKEMMRYLITKLIGEEQILSVTELLLSYNKMSPRNFLLYFSGSDVSDAVKERFISINLKNIPSLKINSTDEFEKVKPYSEVPQYLLDELINEINKTAVTDANDTCQPVLTQERAITFSKLLAIYRRICDCDARANYYFYFLKPITFYEEFRGVFLLGFNRKLNPEEIVFIENINYRILSDVIHSRIKKLTALQENAKNTSHVGHLLRYRLSPPLQYILLLQKEITALAKKMPGLETEEIKKLERLTRSAKVWLDKTTNTGYLLNIKAHYFEKPDAGYKVYLAKEEWRVKGTFSLSGYLSSLVQEINDNQICIHTRRRFAPLKLIPLKEHDILIDPWFKNESEEYRPLDILYEDLLFEILINAFKASPAESDVCIETTRGLVDGLESMIISNQIDPNVYRKNEQAFSSIANRWSTLKDLGGSMGGLTYWSQLIEGTQVGIIRIRVTQRGNQAWFETGLALQGLKLLYG